MLWGYYNMVWNGLQLILHAILSVFECDFEYFWNLICFVQLFFWFYTPNVYRYITVFYRNFLRMAFFIYTIYFRCSRLSPLTYCVSCSSHTPFCSCFVQLALQAQTGTKHERQCAPHDGRLATVCGDSRELLHCVENYSNNLF